MILALGLALGMHAQVSTTTTAITIDPQIAKCYSDGMGHFWRDGSPNYSSEAECEAGTNPTPITCGEHQHDVGFHGMHNCRPVAGSEYLVQCDPDPPQCVDDLHVITEKEWLDVISRLDNLNKTLSRMLGIGGVGILGAGDADIAPAPTCTTCVAGPEIPAKRPASWPKDDERPRYNCNTPGLPPVACATYDFRLPAICGPNHDLQCVASPGVTEGDFGPKTDYNVPSPYGPNNPDPCWTVACQ